MARTYWPIRRDRKGFKWHWGTHGAADNWRGQNVVWRPDKCAPIAFENPGFWGELMRKGDRFMVPLARASSYPLIGAVALHWGDFETRMDKLLASFVAADADPNDRNWRTKQFPKRAELLKQKAASRFPGAIADEVARIVDAASVYQWQRNLVVHGHLTLHIVNGVPFTYASGRVNKLYRSMLVTDEHLERMYHEISFLSGRLYDLSATAKEAGKASWLSSRDRSRLRAFVAKHPSNPPTARTIRPQHPPLRELSLLHHKPQPPRKADQKKRR